MSDLIDRQAALDVTTETVFVEYEDGDPRKEESIILQTKAAIRDRIKALPPVYVPDMNDGDMISRQVAMEMLMAQNVIMDGSEYHNGFNAGVNRAQEVIRNLPSVQPERKTGRWTPDNTDYYRTKFICSVCGESEEVPTMGFGYVPMWGYCPNCGADMRGEAE